jgi:hypothetical protein
MPSTIRSDRFSQIVAWFVPVQTPVLLTVDFVPLPELLAVYARRSPLGTSLRCSTKQLLTTSTS